MINVDFQYRFSRRVQNNTVEFYQKSVGRYDRRGRTVRMPHNLPLCRGGVYQGLGGLSPPKSQDESKMLCENKLNNTGYAIDA